MPTYLPTWGGSQWAGDWALSGEGPRHINGAEGQTTPPNPGSSGLG